MVMTWGGWVYHNSVAQNKTNRGLVLHRGPRLTIWRDEAHVVLDLGRLLKRVRNSPAYLCVVLKY